MSVEKILAGKGRDVVTVDRRETLTEAVATLAARRIGAAIVIDEDGTVIGILSERDVLRAVAEGGGGALGRHVADYMTADPVTCMPASTVDEVMAIMTRGKFRHVPVIESGRLAGVVSIGDMVKHRLAEVEAEHQALRDYIATA